MTEQFVVKHYTGDARPTIKGNGFDGLEIGETREEAEAFVKWLNAKIAGTELIPARELLFQLTAVCEFTEDPDSTPELQESAGEHAKGFLRGRRFEAKGIRRGLNTWFQDESVTRLARQTEASDTSEGVR